MGALCARLTLALVLALRPDRPAAGLPGRTVGVERVAPAEAALLAGALVAAEQDEHARLVGLQGEEPGGEEDGDAQRDEAGDEHPPHGLRAPARRRRAVEERERDEHRAGDVEGDGDDQHAPAAHHPRSRSWVGTLAIDVLMLPPPWARAASPMLAVSRDTLDSGMIP